jgi:hypothetical protein
MTKALKEGNFNYTDPSSLLKKMTQHENARVRGDNKAAPPVRNNVIHLPVTRPEPAPAPSSIAVIHCEGGKEVTRDLPFGTYQTLLDAGALEFTLSVSICGLLPHGGNTHRPYQPSTLAGIDSP